MSISRDDAFALVSARNVVFGGLTVLTAICFLPVLLQIVELSGRAPHYSHLPLIPLVAAYLFFIDGRRIFARVEAAPLAGAVVGGLGLAALATGLTLRHALTGTDGVSLLAVSMVLVWSGLFVGFYGLAAGRAAVFPLGFLLLLAPIPEFLLNAAITFLQHWSAEATYILFKATATPVYREGYLFMLPGVNIEVARQCSGIRSSIALMITALLAGHMFLRGWRTRTALVLFVLPLTVVKNAIRIVGLTLLSIHVDESFLRGSLHREGGIGFFALALVLASPFLWWLRSLEAKGAGAAPGPWNRFMAAWAAWRRSLRVRSRD